MSNPTTTKPKAPPKPRTTKPKAVVEEDVNQPYTIKNVAVEFPKEVALLVLLQACHQDVASNLSGVGREVIGHGVSIGSDFYSIGRVLVDNKESGKPPVDCIKLSRTIGMHTGGIKEITSWLIPIDSVSRSVEIALDVLTVNEEF